MHVSRCRYWWCAACRAVFEKEDLAARLRLFRDASEADVAGSRTCGSCGAAYPVRDIYRGACDVPRQYWGQLDGPIELAEEASPCGTSRLVWVFVLVAVVAAGLIAVAVLKP